MNKAGQTVSLQPLTMLMLLWAEARGAIRTAREMIEASMFVIVNVLERMYRETCSELDGREKRSNRSLVSKERVAKGDQNQRKPSNA